MSAAIVKQLVIKDWYLQRVTIAGYLGAGALAPLLLATGGEGLFYAGSIVLITVLIGLGMHLPMATIVGERTEHTLPFIMTLPISNRDYTTAKIIANLSMFLLPWAALVASVLGVLYSRSAETRALIPFSVLTLVELLTAGCLLIFIALVTESQAWTIGLTVFANLFLQGYLYTVSRVPSIAAGMKAHRLIWSPAAITLLLAELGVIVLLIALTFVFRARKTDFL